MDFYDIYQSKHNGYSRVVKHQWHELKKLFHVDKTHWDGITTRFIARKLGIRTLANFLILYSIYMIGWVFYEPVKAELKYQYDQRTGKQYVVIDSQDAQDGTATDSAQVNQTGQPQKGKLGALLSQVNVEPLIPQDADFSIVIPKLGANARIIKNVNSADESAYMSALRSGVAHAAGTSFPGMGSNIYLFAHSTNTYANVNRYNAIFYLLYKLEQGDEVNVFYNGVRHKYIVSDKKIVQPTEVQYLTEQTDSEQLIMQTCWPPGTVLERMLVFAEPAQ